MGFFSDLKEDLSQAVNELMPGEIGTTTEEQAQNAQEENLANVLSYQEPDDEETLKQLAELERILQNIELPADGENDKALTKSAGEDGRLLDYESLDHQDAQNEDTSGAQGDVEPQEETIAVEEAIAQGDDIAVVATQVMQALEIADNSNSAVTEDGAPEGSASVATEEAAQMAISISIPDEETVKESEAEIQATVGEFRNAVAALKDDRTVAVALPAGVTATTVRYGWDDYPTPSLYNKEGVPVPQFQIEAK